jgi:tellurite resistance protein TerC
MSQELIAGLSVIASLVLIEGLLSVDNVLGIAALAKNLPPAEQKKAIRLGMIGAYAFRVVALLMVSILILNTWVRWLGAGYLIYLMSSHLTKHGDHEEKEGKSLSEKSSFANVLTQIAMMDLSLSIDNVIAAVGLAPKINGQIVMWPIYVGVLIAILALQAIAPHAVKLLERFPIMEPVAFILIGMVGCILTFEEVWHVIYHEHIHVAPQYKFVAIVCIILVAMAYHSKAGVRALFQPLFAIVVPLMKTFAKLCELAMMPISIPLKMLLGAK